MAKEKDAFQPPKSEAKISYKARIAKLQQDQLTKFEIPTGDLDDKEWHQLLQGIKDSKKLRTLVINDVVDDKRAGELAVVLEGNQSLTNIAIISSLMSEKGEYTLAKALVDPEHPNLLEAIVHSGVGVDQFGNRSHVQDRLEEMVEANKALAQRVVKHGADNPLATEELMRREIAIAATAEKKSPQR